MITKEQYIKAKKIVTQYYKEQSWNSDKQTGNYLCKEPEYELCPVCLGDKQLPPDGELGWLPCAECGGEGWIKIKKQESQ